MALTITLIMITGPRTKVNMLTNDFISSYLIICHICHHIQGIWNRTVHDLDLDLYTRLWSHVTMPLERAFDGFYSTTILKFSLSATFNEIFTIKMCTTLTLPFRLDQVKSEYVNGKPICDFMFDGNSNVTSYQLRDICNRSMDDIDLDLYNEPMSNVNMSVDSPRQV